MNDDVKASNATNGSVAKSLPACPVETTMTLIGNKWTVLIVRDLLQGTKRFSELRRSVGNVSQKVLTSNLREMEADGLVNRKVYAEVPPRVEYSLTETGRSLKTVIDAMRVWGTRYQQAMLHPVD
ncbi:helix-turn-helix domain-containing protein [Bifidobacterium sp. ESL0784]|uniref:winged helix-turn-helix transcriptional regulator n=1 Tax=Bifidobacterium sp. ESL0784 TaxID=2983231 RepID=UPI0023F7514B|nr:helix-turn-helix domain-containing protein [Bifidobacterium sp. ESL0784]MDF7641686.1 helix-turn-helix domain-containing protein [Bifidobacterium sp. ESL0784]